MDSNKYILKTRYGKDANGNNIYVIPAESDAYALAYDFGLELINNQFKLLDAINFVHGGTKWRIEKYKTDEAYWKAYRDYKHSIDGVIENVTKYKKIEIVAKYFKQWFEENREWILNTVYPDIKYVTDFEEAYIDNYVWLNDLFVSYKKYDVTLQIINNKYDNSKIRILLGMLVYYIRTKRDES